MHRAAGSQTQQIMCRKEGRKKKNKKSCAAKKIWQIMCIKTQKSIHIVYRVVNYIFTHCVSFQCNPCNQIRCSVGEGSRRPSVGGANH
jgi:hypothetical protein